MTARTGVAGLVATVFLRSKLTPLVVGGSLLLGAYAVVALPREEEPQIIVPMVDVTVERPGSSPREIEQQVAGPIERLLWEVPGVEYVYSTSSQDRALVIVRFLVGTSETDALVRLNQKLAARPDLLPADASPPLVQLRAIDDVPIMALTLSGAGFDDHSLRQTAAQLREVVKEVPDVADVTIIGGRPRMIGVDLDPGALSARGLNPLSVQRALAAAGVREGRFAVTTGGAAVRVEAGETWASVADLRRTVVGTVAGAPVQLGDVARVFEGGGEPTSYVRQFRKGSESRPAVTVSIAKRKGANAITVARAIEAKVATVRGYLLPATLDVDVTRNYGDTAEAKSNELLWHMFLAVVSVSVLIWLTLGFRESLVVLVAIPVTLALTLFVFYLYGYTLNRITLFALIFSIGILVDDAIVIVENIVRHARMSSGESMDVVAVRAVNEVGNPTILATLTVIAAILPMAFVGGLMGPYMRPIPVGASAAMVFSLLVAFVVTPWAAVRLLRTSTHAERGADDRLTAVYRRSMSWLMSSFGTQAGFLVLVAVLLVAAAAFVPLGWVTVKMLPFDNKSEVQVIVHMPEGTSLEVTERAAADLARAALEDAAVTSVQSYAGTSSPFTFNGLVRHYFLRQEPHLADLQILLVDPEARSEQSHDVAKRLRARLAPVGTMLGATLQVVEVPPGPPVLQTIVAEVYGPDPAARQGLAGQVRDLLQRTAGVVDVDWYVDAARQGWQLDVDPDRAAAAGVSSAELGAVVRMAGAGSPAGYLRDGHAREPVPVVLRLPREARGSLAALDSLPVGAGGARLGSLVTRRTIQEPLAVYHKNLLPVTYVTADVAGATESPVYAILQANRALAALKGPTGHDVSVFNATQPVDPTEYALKWDGEWHVTIEVFRDLGIAFAAVLVLIYVLVVGWFQSFNTPMTIMLAIPFSLVGILPAHAALGAFFTATSMIGFIAGAGIVVRNSIILVDFIELRVREGMPLREAVVDAGAVRFRPMALTAAAVIAGSAVILFDPIFQGLAISLMAGEVASLLLSRMTVPITYYLTHVRGHAWASRPVAPAPTEVMS